MADQWPAPVYTDGDFTVATPCSLPVLSSPIPGLNEENVLRQDFMQLRKNFSPLALNTAHPSSGATPDFSAWKLVEEGERQDMGCGVVRWTRTYAKKPSSHTEFETYGYNYIGFYGAFGINTTSATGRQRFSFVARSKVVYDYYLIAATGGDYTAVTDIPIIDATLYLVQAGSVLYTDYLADSPPFATATSPDRTTYEGWMTTDAGTASSFSIVAETSQLTRWMGNIWQRRTRYIKAL